MYTSRIFAQALVVSAAALLPPATAQADWRHLVERSAAPIRPNTVKFSPDGSLWSFSNDGVRRSDASGATLAVLRSASMYGFDSDNVGSGELLADGGALLDVSSDEESPNIECAVLRVGADLHTTWRLPLAATGSAYCPGRVTSNGAGDAWLSGGGGGRAELYALDRNGTLHPAFAVGPANASLNGVLALDNGDAVVATSDNGVQLARYDRHGRRIWHWEQRTPGWIGQLTQLPSGGYAATMRSNDERFPSEVMRWSADGSLRWSYVLPADQRVAYALLPTRGDGLYVVSPSGAYISATVTRLSNLGGVQWQRTLDCTRSGYPPVVSADRDDGIALLCSDETARSLLRLDSSGNTQASIALTQQASSLQQLPDGRLLLLNRNAPADAGLQIVGNDNQLVPAPLNDYRDAGAAELSAATASADGSSYLLSTGDSADGTVFRFSRVLADGQLAWTRRLAGIPVSPSAAGDRVCYKQHAPANGMPAALVCLRSSDGSELWRVAVDAWNSSYALRLLADGRVFFVRDTGIGYELLRVAANGSVVATPGSDGPAMAAAVDASGRTTVVTTTHTLQYAADGSTRYRLDNRISGLQFFSTFGEFRPSIAAADDGSVALYGRSDDAQSGVWAIAADGSSRWIALLGDLTAGHLLHAADAVYVLKAPAARSTQPNRSQLARLRMSDGSIAWQFESDNPPDALGFDFGSQVAANADTSRLLVAHTWGDRLRLESIDSASGLRVAERFIACDERCAQPQYLALDAQGSARIGLTVLTTTGQTAALLSVAATAPWRTRTSTNVRGAR